MQARLYFPGYEIRDRFWKETNRIRLNVEKFQVWGRRGIRVDHGITRSRGQIHPSRWLTSIRINSKGRGRGEAQARMVWILLHTSPTEESRVTRGTVFPPQPGIFGNYLMAAKSSLIAGVFSFLSAFASIWRIRSRVTDKL